MQYRVLCTYTHAGIRYQEVAEQACLPVPEPRPRGSRGNAEVLSTWHIQNEIHHQVACAEMDLIPASTSTVVAFFFPHKKFNNILKQCDLSPFSPWMSLCMNQHTSPCSYAPILVLKSPFYCTPHSCRSTLPMHTQHHVSSPGTLAGQCYATLSGNETSPCRH